MMRGVWGARLAQFLKSHDQRQPFPATNLVTILPGC